MISKSPFLHVYLSDGNPVYFHSLTLELYGSPGDCPTGDEEEELVSRLRARTRENRGIVMVCLFLTTRCSRSCGYCFLQGVPERDMTGTEISSGMRLIGNKPADLLLYGGEPFLRQDLVRLAVLGARNSGAVINISAATGGVPVDRSLCSELAEENAFIIVSIDGPPEVHNRIRPLKQGGSSFKAAEQAFHAFKDAGCRVGISVTVTQGNLSTVRNDFVWLMENFNPDDMGLNPWLHPLKGGVPNQHQAAGSDIFKAIADCMETAIDRSMYIEQLARRVRPFTSRTPRLKDCASSGGRLVLVPGGIAGACDCMTVCGDHGVPIENTDAVSGLLNNFRDLSPLNFSSCHRCPALALCGGGCRYDALHASGSIRGIREDRCTFEREFLEWMIRRTIRSGRESLVPAGGFLGKAVPMPLGTMIGEESVGCE